MKQVIAINGLKRSGKDYSANILKQQLEAKGLSVELMAFAEPIKQIVSTMFNISLEQLDNYKNNPNENFIRIFGKQSKKSSRVSLQKITDFRDIIQRFGNGAMKQVFGKNVWADLLAYNISKSHSDVVIVTDMRFPEEAQSLEDATLNENSTHFNGRGIIYVSIIGPEPGVKDSHPSEQKLDIKFDYVINNVVQNKGLNEQLELISEELNG